MSYPQTGPVAVQTPEEKLAVTFPWATSVRVDRKGTLHVHGRHQQHAVFLKGEWTGYLVTAPARETGDVEDA